AAPPSRKGIIRKFIDDHSHEPVKIGDLARFLYISPSRTVHLVTELFGMSFQELLLEERMTRARNLLLSTSYPTKEIAVETGYKNVFYFNRVFRNFYGIPPGRFRAKNSVKQ
ncbi:MAG: AraC family transcriptional regulator, partial [Lentisphaerota bacterium]